MLNTTGKIMTHKTGLPNLAEDLGNVSKACQVMGLSGDTALSLQGGARWGRFRGLFERTRRKPNRTHCVDQAIQDAVIISAADFRACVFLPV